MNIGFGIDKQDRSGKRGGKRRVLDHHRLIGKHFGYIFKTDIDAHLQHLGTIERDHGTAIVA